MQQIKNKSRNNMSAQQPLPHGHPTAPWYKKVWFLVSGIAVVIFTLILNGPTILQNIRIMPAEIRTTLDQYLSWIHEDAEWTGQWSTFPQGIVDMEDMKLSDGVDLKLHLISENGELGGEISTEAICKKVPFDFLMIRGKVNGRTARVTVWDIVGGRKVDFADIDLVRETDIITIKPVSGQVAWFPSGARVGKHPNLEERFMSDFCNRRSVTTNTQKRRVPIDQLIH